MHNHAGAVIRAARTTSMRPFRLICLCTSSCPSVGAEKPGEGNGKAPRNTRLQQNIAVVAKSQSTSISHGQRSNNALVQPLDACRQQRSQTHGKYGLASRYRAVLGLHQVICYYGLLTAILRAENSVPETDVPAFTAQGEKDTPHPYTSVNTV